MRVIFLVLAVCALPAQTMIDKERALGRRLSEDLKKRFAELPLPEAREYLAGLGRRLVAHAPADLPAYSYEFSIVKGEPDPAPEPYALPGGYILVSAFVFQAVNSESELAALAAHSIAHIALRHGIRSSGNGPAGSIPLVFLGGWSGFGNGGLMPAAMWPEMRQAELAADAFAARLLSAAGFHPRALREYIAREQTTGRGHMPSRQERLDHLDQVLTSLADTAEPAPPGDLLRVKESVRPYWEAMPMRKPALRRTGEDPPPNL
jgi:predicted Zn-dependent protease